MRKCSNVPVGAFWNSWSRRPSELVFLPDGVTVTPVLYSSRLRKAMVPGPLDMRMGRHDLDGDHIAFETDHGGTGLAFAYDKPDPFRVTGSWSLRHRDEWALRYWVTLCLSGPEGEEVRLDEASGTAFVTVGQRTAALATAATPVLVTGHDSIEDLAADFESHGYFNLASRATSGRVLALRFTLEMTPDLCFAATVADSPELARSRARDALQPAKVNDPTLQSGRFDGALDAVRDILGWNTLYDPAHARRYTTMSRIWNIGDFAVWYNDQTFAALMAGLLDGELARENFAVALDSATPQGNIACLATSRDIWVDRSQAPHGAFMAWLLWLRGGDRALLERAWPTLAANHRWWRAQRDPDGMGMVSCGTSQVGSALYSGTAFGARNETGMDNSATHDEAVYDPVTRSLSTFDLGLNAALALDAEMLARIGGVLGHREEAAEFAALGEDTRDRIRTTLWDEERGLFANRQRSGGFVRSVGPTSFYPLLCGAADADQARRLLAHLADPAMFGGRYPLPNASRDDPAYQDNVYWRGRIWPNVNFFVWQGLRRYGFDAEARDLAEKSMAMFDQNWLTDRHAGENYNAETGEITDSKDTDPFYTWGAMLPLLGVSEVMDISPWRGWEITNEGTDLRLGPILSPAGRIDLVASGGAMEVRRGGHLLWSTDLKGSLRHIRVESGQISFRLAEDCAGTATFRLGQELAARLVAASVDGKPAKTYLEGGMAALALTGLRAGQLVAFHLDPTE